MTPWTAGHLLCLWNFSGKNARAGCHFLLQKIEPTSPTQCIYVNSNLIQPHFTWDFFSSLWKGQLPSLTPKKGILSIHSAPQPLFLDQLSWPIPFPLAQLKRSWDFPSTNNFTGTKEEAKEEHTKTQKQMSLQRQISYLAELPGESASSPLPAPSIKKRPWSFVYSEINTFAEGDGPPLF